ncbi:nucleoplasmin-2 isoform X3 [Ovis aries]|uniref:nucleoplasmin-2 isoform X3 n=1 Tax=Ovis aries TaxID=9940 RepID=UPI0005FC3176|nr:nucleoplasmin-2 isoform X3 [Ovis aries]
MNCSAPARIMNRSAISSTSEKETLSLLWGCELNQERPTWTFKPQKISLGEKAKEEVNVVEILPSASQEDKKRRPLTLASLRASVLPMVVLGLEFSPPVTFQLRAGSGPVFLCGQEHYNGSWEEVEEEEDDLEEEEDDDDDDEDMFLEETPIKQVKRLAPQKQTSAGKEKKVEKKDEAVRHHLKGSPAGKPKKPGR